jgi:1,4-dihydroxy-2-naphthoate octaprenyltransferase
VALTAALVLGACALSASIFTSVRARNAPLTLPLALLMIGLSWAYSAPPLRLLSRGFGELTTALVVTLLTPLLGFYLQSGALRLLPVLASLPLCGLQFAMLLTIELPDAAGDSAIGKRTLVVRRGAEWGARSGAGIVLGSFCFLPVLVLLGLPWQIAALAALSAPLGAWHALRLLRGAFRDPEHWESLAFCSVALLAATTSAELVGALLTLRMG